MGPFPAQQLLLQRHDLSGDEVAGRVADGPFLVGQPEVHVLTDSSPGRAPSARTAVDVATGVTVRASKSDPVADSITGPMSLI
ncbi:hypothetical protein [Micromonospora sp. WMMD1082]|uniref:hypothetical protein n=1 Tax=Micromonospora sp. WMMD1082 TaxID=3016104 RepID=UPI002416E09D|nr:hypothetical protein [Micromonospora sp. WMMD1082]MDG4797896.1 hypothetical protein [Micromonospora sp. WMMD1082]